MSFLRGALRIDAQPNAFPGFLEPGEACALYAGYLAAHVLDVLQNGETQIAVLNTSAACHMPDVLEMPYRPPLYGAKEPGELPFTVRLCGSTCLAGDVIGDYSFDRHNIPSLPVITCQRKFRIHYFPISLCCSRLKVLETEWTLDWEKYPKALFS